MRSKEISLGGYLPAKSVIHDLDPRTKLIGFIITLTMVLFLRYSYRVIFPVFLAGCTISLSGLGWRVWLQGLRKIWIMLLITFILNFSLNNDGRPIDFFGLLTPFSYEGLNGAIFLTGKIALVAIFSLALTFTTLPWDIVKGLKFFVNPLAKIRASIGDSFVVLFLALRFVPLLQEEWTRLIQAQESRGLDFSSGTVITRGRRLMSLIVPSMILAFRKAEELSTAMSARGFRPGEKRTDYNPLEFRLRDLYAFLVIGVVFLGVVIP
ncbi:MAG: energy-coupling factor transporter transmembrane component T family protein [Desulfomonilaceae bacterium]